MLAKDNGSSDFIWETDHEARNKLWKARHEWWYAGLALEPGKKVNHCPHNIIINTHNILYYHYICQLLVIEEIHTLPH